LVIGASNVGIETEVEIVGEEADDAPSERFVANAQRL
jgi:hypothetical protein